MCLFSTCQKPHTRLNTEAPSFDSPAHNPGFSKVEKEKAQPLNNELLSGSLEREMKKIKLRKFGDGCFATTQLHNREFRGSA
mmetsp:Transcript_42085/g.71527  ORF Transcript_42085/g.71527 Transcript_42085/m.71527 type:complete len:82 (+) Transcript_42085:181-426(+)